MNTPVKRVIYAALGRKCDQSRGPTKHRIETFSPKRGCRVPKKTL